MNEHEQINKERKARPATIDASRFNARSIKIGIWALVVIELTRFAIDYQTLILAILEAE